MTKWMAYFRFFTLYTPSYFSFVMRYTLRYLYAVAFLSRWRHQERLFIRIAQVGTKIFLQRVHIVTSPFLWATSAAEVPSRNVLEFDCAPPDGMMLSDQAARSMAWSAWSAGRRPVSGQAPLHHHRPKKLGL